jgi:hypothetical protein
MNSAQMVVTAVSVGSDGAVNLGPWPMYGILIALLVSHAIVCSSATHVIARLTLVYAVVNGEHDSIKPSNGFIY